MTAKMLDATIKVPGKNGGWCHGLILSICTTFEHTEHYWLVVWNMAFMTFHILGISSSQLTNSYFSEGWLNHQPVKIEARLQRRATNAMETFFQIHS